MQQKPSMGRIVRYVDADGEEFPAIILRVAEDGLVSLKVMTESGDFALSGVPHNEARDASERETWHWPPRDQPEGTPLAFTELKSEPRVDPALNAATVAALDELRGLLAGWKAFAAKIEPLVMEAIAKR